MLVQNLSAFFLKTKQFVDTDKESLVTSRSSRLLPSMLIYVCFFSQAIETVGSVNESVAEKDNSPQLGSSMEKDNLPLPDRPPMQKGARHFFTYTPVLCLHCKILNLVCHFQAPTICACRCSKQSEQVGQIEVETSPG